MVITKAPEAISPTIPYVGRFAPSPTGPLHRGSLVAAVASYLDARVHKGRWLLRIEDVDRERSRSVWASRILRDLEALGFEWDGPVVFQQAREAAYLAAFEQLRREGWVYPCACTRREVADFATRGLDGYVYPGTCRGGLAPGRAPRAWRMRVVPGECLFEDRVQGPSGHDLAACVGDYVLRRADQCFAYQLAVVVDDAEAGVTDVVRGADLLDSTPRQIWLQTCLRLPLVRYLHVPVLLSPAGEKLSKQTHAPAVDAARPAAVIWQALRDLGAQPPEALRAASLAEVWQWGLAAWLPLLQTDALRRRARVMQQDGI